MPDESVISDNGAMMVSLLVEKVTSAVAGFPSSTLEERKAILAEVASELAAADLADLEAS